MHSRWLGLTSASRNVKFILAVDADDTAVTLPSTAQWGDASETKVNSGFKAY